MRKHASLVKLGFKYLYRYRRRYGFLLAALVFCFAAVTLITSVKDGMYDSVYYSAQSHYAGDIIAIGYSSVSSRRHIEESEVSAILEAAHISGIEPRHTVMRTFGYISTVYYNGTGIDLKYLEGCDWENEGHIFGKMSFDAGPDNIVGEDGIIISLPTANQLNAKMGDMVIIETETRLGQRNTGNFIVKGIVNDSSIFGYYKAYISRVSLNRLLLYGDGDCSTVGFFLDNPSDSEKGRAALHMALSGKVLAGPLVRDRDELDIEGDKTWMGNKIFLLTLPVYLSEISDLLDAMNILAYFLYGMMLLIVLVSAVVTYRLVMHERTKEIGIMRTIGFLGNDLRLVLWTEIIALGVISLFSGFLLARIMSGALSLVSFSWFPGFEIFLKGGKLKAMFLPGTMLVNVVSIFAILFASAIVPSIRASRKNLPGLLSGEPL